MAYLELADNIAKQDTVNPKCCSKNSVEGPFVVKILIIEMKFPEIVLQYKFYRLTLK